MTRSSRGFVVAGEKIGAVDAVTLLLRADSLAAVEHLEAVGQQTGQQVRSLNDSL